MDKPPGGAIIAAAGGLSGGGGVMGIAAFFCGLLLCVMGFGRWHETGSPWWLGGTLALLALVLVGGIMGGGKKKAG